jgi:hypothetical protein
VTVSRDGDTYVIQAKINKPCKVQLVGVKEDRIVEFSESGEVTV